MQRQATRILAMTILLAALAGCDERDPYLRTDVWRPTGANAGNIAAMAADPRDLIRGHGDIMRDTQAPALNVGRIWSDQPKLLSGQTSGGSGGGSSGSSSGGS